jgi:hypothetical protein
MYVTSSLYKKLIGAGLCVSEPCTWASGIEGRPSSVEQCIGTVATSSQACQGSWQLSVATWASISSKPWHGIYVSYCNSPPACNRCCTWLCCDVRPCLSYRTGQYTNITLKKYMSVRCLISILAQHTSGPDREPMKNRNMTIFKDSDLLRHDVGFWGGGVASNILKDHSASKTQGTLAQWWHSVTSQKTSVFSSSAVRTSNLAQAGYHNALGSCFCAGSHRQFNAGL